MVDEAGLFENNLIDTTYSSCTSDACTLTWPSEKPDLTSKRYFVRITAGEQTFTNVFTVARNEIAYDVQIRKEGNENVRPRKRRHTWRILPGTQ